MRASQRLIASDGFEVMLFPLEYMYISQGEGESYSHLNTLNIDFLGYGANGRIYQCPYYAPCSCKCIATTAGSNNGRVFQSTRKVHLADNTLRKVTFVVMHDDNPIASVGDTFTQGDLLGHTGTAGNVTGDHVHLNTAYGTYQGFEQVTGGQYQLINSSHIYQTCYVNDTVLVEDYNYTWLTYSGGNTYLIKKGKFPWVLYARKIRENLTKYS